jgi:hypothetical protein
VQKAGARLARDQAMAGLQEKYEAAQRTRQIDLLRRENQRKEADLNSRRHIQLLTSFVAAHTVLGGAVVLLLYRRAARGAQQRQAARAEPPARIPFDARPPHRFAQPPFFLGKDGRARPAQRCRAAP